MNQFTVRWKKVGEALQGVGILFILLPVVVIGGFALVIWIFTDYWRALVSLSTAVGWFMLSIADQEPPKPKGAAIFRVVPSSPKGVQAAEQKPPEPKSQEEKDKALEIAEMQRDHWHKISMFLLGLVGILVTALGLLLRNAWPTK